MGLWDKLTGQFIEVIDWTDDRGDTLVYRFPVADRAIKQDAQLTVREGQAAVFLNEGELGDVFTPGRYVLNTQNIPILTALKSWKYGFNSPFKADVLFVSTTQKTGLKWGTQNPIMLRDADFGVVRMRAFGTYAVRVTDPAAFVRQVVGTQGTYTTEAITETLRRTVVSRFTDVLGEAKIPALDLAAQYDELGKLIQGRIAPDFTALGLELTSFLIENLSLPPEVEAALDKRSGMGAVGNLDQYFKYQMANALDKPSGGGGNAGMELGAGMAMGKAMMDAMARPTDPAVNPSVGGAAATAQPGVGADETRTKLREFKSMFDDGLITQDEFDSMKRKLLGL